MYFIQIRVVKIFIFLFCVVSSSIVAAQQSHVDTNYGQVKCKKTVFNDTLYFDSNYFSEVKKDQYFFVIDSADFTKHQILVTNYNHNIGIDKDLFFSLKFYTDNSLSVKYQPEFLKNNLFSSRNSYMDNMAQYSSTQKLISKPINLKKEREKMFVNNPILVKYLWDELADPQTLSYKRHLRRHSVNRVIGKTINYDSNKQLKERKLKEGPWFMGGVENLQLSQTQLSNWTKGGKSTISLRSDLTLSAKYIKEEVEWESFFRHKLGIVGSDKVPVQINTDQIELFSKYGIKASDKWFYSAVADFKSQLFNDYKTNDKQELLSTLFSPAYFTFSVGMDYKPNENFTLMLSPFALQLTYVMDTARVDQTKYEVDADKKSDSNKGFMIMNTYKWEISPQYQLKSNLNAFVGYGGDLYQIDWDLIFDVRINRYLTTRLNPQFRYFTNESKNLQLREYFAINFIYKF